MFYILRITAAKATLHLKKDWIEKVNNNFPLRVVFSRCLIFDETLYLVFDTLRIKKDWTKTTQYHLSYSL